MKRGRLKRRQGLSPVSTDPPKPVLCWALIGGRDLHSDRPVRRPVIWTYSLDRAELVAYVHDAAPSWHGFWRSRQRLGWRIARVEVRVVRRRSKRAN